MATLPRELHVWLTSLNLSYKITNPKRDLSNGYIFAEIFNRYFPEEIEMYSVDNGFKLSIKQNNWEFLQRFFNKKKIQITFADYVSYNLDNTYFFRTQWCIMPRELPLPCWRRFTVFWQERKLKTRLRTLERSSLTMLNQQFLRKLKTMKSKELMTKRPRPMSQRPWLLHIMKCWGLNGLTRIGLLKASMDLLH